jgi:uncharacterized RDD family membrane protein YckC
MKKAKSGKRILAFILDTVIVSLVASLICSFFEDPVYLEQLAAIEEAYMNGSMDLVQYSEALAALVDPNLGIKLIVETVLLVAYFIVLPLFWKNQTIGRAASKIKVVKEDNTPVNAVNLIIREGIGQTLFVSVFSLLSAFLNVNIITTINEVLNTIVGFILIIGFFKMCGKSKKTLYDSWSKTIVISTEETAKPKDDFEIIKDVKDNEQEVIDIE